MTAFSVVILYQALALPFASINITKGFQVIAEFKKKL